MHQVMNVVDSYQVQDLCITENVDYASKLDKSSSLA